MNDLYFPKFKIFQSVDVIRLKNINPAKFQLINKILKENGFSVKSDSSLKDGNYKRIKSYISMDKKIVIDLLYKQIRLKNKYPSLLLQIHDPFPALLDLLDNVFKRHYIFPKLVYMEIPLDFFTGDILGLENFIRNHLFLKYQKSKSFFFKTTFYTNNIRKSVKGARVYEKTGDGNRFLRLEFVLAERKLQDLGLEFPLKKLFPFDFRKFFDFRILNEDHLRDYLVWKERDKIAEINSRRPGFGGIINRHIESRISSKFGYEDSLMGKVEILKSEYFGILNYSRFLEPYKEFNLYFNQTLNNIV